MLRNYFPFGPVSASLAKALTEMGVQAADEDMADLFEKYRKKFPKRYRTYMDSEGFDYSTFFACALFLGTVWSYSVVYESELHYQLLCSCFPLIFVPTTVFADTFMEDMRKFLGPLDAHRGDWQQASKIAQLGLEDQA